MQHNEDYVLGVLQDGGLVTRKQIDGARSRLNGEPGVLEVLISDGALSEVDVSRMLAALGLDDDMPKLLDLRRLAELEISQGIEI